MFPLYMHEAVASLPRVHNDVSHAAKCIAVTLWAKFIGKPEASSSLGWLVLRHNGRLMKSISCGLSIKRAKKTGKSPQGGHAIADP